MGLCLLGAVALLLSPALDTAWLLDLNPDKTNAWVTVNQFISNNSTFAAYAIPVLILLYGWLKKNRDLQWKALVLATSALVAALLSTSIKLLVHRQRLFLTDTNIFKYGEGGSYSFPSGHTTEAFAMATAVSLAFPRWYVVVPAYALACAVAFSRMYLGVHYPSDVLAGIVLGTGTSLVFHLMAKHRRASNANV